ncbi:hypothetical protein PV08_06455 [Exophiala spinifera]|uniref:Uncharacterized protein n=1 Tax=Exophiala spinifera TaxID=91928 RepID=A0A0D2BBL4_9EURO|nr:uncharacterized protein PV08_06455 [Exophiala spinifera]KIW16403.1 hypothetical protein PV08_06455 [Exophiala spinifera]
MWPTNLNLHLDLNRYPGQTHGAPSYTVMQYVDQFNPFAIQNLPRDIIAAGSAEARRSPVLMGSLALLVAICGVVISLLSLHVVIIPIYRYMVRRRFSYDSDEDAERALQQARVEGPFKFNGLQYCGYVEPVPVPRPATRSSQYGSISKHTPEPDQDKQSTKACEVIRPAASADSSYSTIIEYSPEDCTCGLCLQCQRHA